MDRDSTLACSLTLSTPKHNSIQDVAHVYIFTRCNILQADVMYLCAAQSGLKRS